MAIRCTGRLPSCRTTRQPAASAAKRNARTASTEPTQTGISCTVACSTYRRRGVATSSLREYRPNAEGVICSAASVRIAERPGYSRTNPSETGFYVYGEINRRGRQGRRNRRHRLPLLPLQQALLQQQVQQHHH